MRRNIKKVLFVVLMLLLIIPVNLKALQLTEVNHSFLYIAESCGDSLLGDPGDPNSVAWLLQQVLNIIKIVGPILVIVLSSIDFAKVIVKSDDESMAKARKKLITRLILAALLFFIPILVSVLLDLFGLTSAGTCGLS